MADSVSVQAGPFPLPGNGYAAITHTDRQLVLDATGVSIAVRKRPTWSARMLTLTGPASKIDAAKSMAEALILRSQARAAELQACAPQDEATSAASSTAAAPKTTTAPQRPPTAPQRSRLVRGPPTLQPPPPPLPDDGEWPQWPQQGPWQWPQQGQWPQWPQAQWPQAQYPQAQWPEAQYPLQWPTGHPLQYTPPWGWVQTGPQTEPQDLSSSEEQPRRKKKGERKVEGKATKEVAGERRGGERKAKADGKATEEVAGEAVDSKSEQKDAKPPKRRVSLTEEVARPPRPSSRRLVGKGEADGEEEQAKKVEKIKGERPRKSAKKEDEKPRRSAKEDEAATASEESSSSAAAASTEPPLLRPTAKVLPRKVPQQPKEPPPPKVLPRKVPQQPKEPPPPRVLEGDFSPFKDILVVSCGLERMGVDPKIDIRPEVQNPQRMLYRVVDAPSRGRTHYSIYVHPSRGVLQG
jgi:hypothetical protein